MKYENYLMHEDNGRDINRGCFMDRDDREKDCDSECSVKEERQYPSASRFWKTKQYLHKIRDGIRRCELLEQRINLRLHDPDGSEYPDTDKLDDELMNAEEQVNDDKIMITDLISRLPDVNQQLVTTERYVYLRTWEEIAEKMHTSVRIVQKIHGKALPLLEKLIEEEKEL